MSDQAKEIKAAATRFRAEGGNTKPESSGGAIAEVDAEAAPFKLVNITTQGYEGWANLIYTGPEWDGGCVAMVHPPVAAAFRTLLAARRQAGDAGMDGKLLDFLDQWVDGNRKDGHHWFTFAFDTKQSARAQIKAEMDRAAATPGDAQKGE